MATKSKEIFSNFPVPPGTALKEEIEARTLPQQDVADSLGISLASLQRILGGKKAITADIALDLETIIDGISAQFWLNMEYKYRLTLARNRRGYGKAEAGYRVADGHTVYGADTAR